MKKIKVKEITKTCDACPAQWEGITKGEDRVYIRYRYGILRVDLNGETVYAKPIGDGMDGVMDYDELRFHTKGTLKLPKIQKWSDDLLV